MPDERIGQSHDKQNPAMGLMAGFCFCNVVQHRGSTSANARSPYGVPISRAACCRPSNYTASQLSLGRMSAPPTPVGVDRSILPVLIVRGGKTRREHGEWHQSLLQYAALYTAIANLLIMTSAPPFTAAEFFLHLAQLRPREPLPPSRLELRLGLVERRCAALGSHVNWFSDDAVERPPPSVGCLTDEMQTKLELTCSASRPLLSWKVAAIALSEVSSPGATARNDSMVRGLNN
jgi:hypothetical protein